MLAYTYGYARDMQSVGSTVQANMPTVVGQNYLATSYADNDLRHRIIGYANYRIEYGDKFGGATTFTLGTTANSGFKLSYIYSNDMNGDGQNNDLIYVPNAATELTFAQFTAGGKPLPQPINRQRLMHGLIVMITCRAEEVNMLSVTDKRFHG